VPARGLQRHPRVGPAARLRRRPEIDLWILGRELKRTLPGSYIAPKNIENAVLRRRTAVATGASLDVLDRQGYAATTSLRNSALC
jgi:hypothetical protein